MSIQENLREINLRIDEALAKSNRSRVDLTLIGVTKTIDIERIQELVKLGVRDLGENRVQELLTKLSINQAQWHLIGHLQTNKVKFIVDKVTLIHSVDSFKLAQEINKEAKKQNIVVEILVEVNVAKEESKYGVLPEKVKELVLTIQELENVKLSGLMTVAPFVDNPQKNRKIFQDLRAKLIDINAVLPYSKKMERLSMGMSNDYEVAIEEGATIVRIGTKIFGDRNTKEVKNG